MNVRFYYVTIVDHIKAILNTEVEYENGKPFPANYGKTITNKLPIYTLHVKLLLMSLVLGQLAFGLLACG